MRVHGGLTVALLATLMGCGSKESGTTGEPDPVVRMPTSEPKVCAPGKTEPCACPGGAQGAQRCDAHGTGYEECVCPEATPAPAPKPAPEPSPTPTIGRELQDELGSSCAPCKTQEDFDAAAKRGEKCCPIVACTSDGTCGARVCCKFPGGQMCADAGRCSPANRVSLPPKHNAPHSKDEECLMQCPGGELSRCYCVCMGQC